MTQPSALSPQIAWAEGQRRQHLRIAARNPADSAARLRAQRQASEAAGAIRTLQALARAAQPETHHV